MSGCTPHCSVAKSVPVRPKPGAGCRQPGDVARFAQLHAGGTLDQRLDDDCGQRGTALVDHPAGLVEAARRAERRRPHDWEPQRVEDVGPEAAVTQGEPTDSVAVIGATERQVAGATGDPLVRPVLEGDLQRLLDSRCAVGGEEEVRLIDRHDLSQRLGQRDHDAVAVAEHR